MIRVNKAIEHEFFVFPNEGWTPIHVTGNSISKLKDSNDWARSINIRASLLLVFEGAADLVDITLLNFTFDVRIQAVLAHKVLIMALEQSMWWGLRGRDPWVKADEAELLGFPGWVAWLSPNL